jgi:phosphatidyl-myo-inositol dimannoside synthase
LKQGLPRVLLLFTTFRGNGGIQRFNRMMISALTQLPVRCEVLSLDTPAPPAEGSNQPGGNVHTFAGARIRYAAAVARRGFLERYDHVVIGHVNLLQMAAVIRYLQGFRGAQMWLVAHGIEVWSGIGRSRRLAIEQLSGILAVSEYTRQRVMCQAPRLPPQRCVLFPLALSHTWTVNPRSMGSGRNGRVRPKQFLLSVTRLDSKERYKGILTVLESLRCTADPCLEYVVAGSGDDEEFLRRTARRLGVGDRVHFLGSLSDTELAELYQECIAFVLPSANEGFGLVFLEAMFFNAPVIGAAAKGILDVIRPDETGLLVPYGDVVALVKAIDRIVGDRDLRNRLQTGARRNVVEGGVFTFEAFVSRTATLLNLRGGLEP